MPFQPATPKLAVMEFPIVDDAVAQGDELAQMLRGLPGVDDIRFGQKLVAVVPCNPGRDALAARSLNNGQ